MRGERLPLELLRHRDNTIAELQLVNGWLHREGHHGYAHRVRAVLLRRLDHELIYVVREAQVSERRVLHWFELYRNGGLPLLLRPILKDARQCRACGFLGPRELFKRRENLCLECQRLWVQRYRSTDKGAAAARRYNRSRAHRRSLARYFATDKGKAARQRAYLSHALRAFRADQARAAGL